MHIQNEVAGSAIIAAAIIAHAWSGRIQGDPRILSAVGWVINVLVVLLTAALFVEC